MRSEKGCISKSNKKSRTDDLMIERAAFQVPGLLTFTFSLPYFSCILKARPHRLPWNTSGNSYHSQIRPSGRYPEPHSSCFLFCTLCGAASFWDGFFISPAFFPDNGLNQRLLSDHQYFLELPVYWGLSPGAYYQYVYPDTDMRYALCILCTTFHLAAENIWPGICISRNFLPVRNIHDSQICSSLQIRRWNQDWPAANGKD